MTDTISTLTELLLFRAASHPDRKAYGFLSDEENEEAALTYGELDRQARAIAAMLETLARRGARILLLYPSGLEFIAGFFGCLYAGMIAVPAYPPKNSRNSLRLQAIVEDAGAEVALTTTSVFKTAEKRINTDMPLTGIKWVATDNIFPGAELEWKKPAITEDSVAFLQYTSGSTGTPKGVMVSQGNIIHNERMIKEAFGHTEKSVFVGWLPLFHDMGLIGNVLQPLYFGGSCILMSPSSFLQKPLRWLRAISRYRATTGGGPNFGYDLCIKKISPEQREGLNLSSWEVAYNGAEPVRAETLERFIEAFEPYGFRRETFYPCYGMAEATLFIAGGIKTEPVKINRVDSKALLENCAESSADKERRSKEIVGCGRAWLGQEIAIVDPESMEELPEATVGEIYVSGPSIAKGYWNNPAETARVFNVKLPGSGRGPYLRTGDLGFMSQGELYITGRQKDLIIIRGKNHYPRDIEVTVWKSHPAFITGNGAAFSIEEAGEEKLVIVQEVERKAIREMDTGQMIRAALIAVAEEHELQVHAIRLINPASIPKTSSGKIQRYVCRDAYFQNKLETIGEWDSKKTAELPEKRTKESKAGSANDIQNWLRMKVAEMVHISPEEIDIKEPFARYGLDSIAAVSLTGELEELLGNKLSPVLAYDYPTIESLSRYLCGDERRDPKERKELKRGGIAIIGIGCKFPGAQNPTEFWEMLRRGGDAIKEVPADRWDIEDYYDSRLESQNKMNTRWGGFLEKVDEFDAFFFGISPREASDMDPQQRLLLEVAWEALENSGIAADRIAGSQTGVFIGISSSDYYKSMLKVPTRAGTGVANSIAANRLSYFFDLCGPSMAVDTACSSSLVAVHLACQSLLTGESDMAMAGGVNMILSPELTIAFSQAGMMATDGRCKAFDASADGYVRGEGCGIVVLKRLSDALTDRDRIIAVIKGTAINQDGRSNGLTAPNGLAQQTVIRKALKNANVSPDLIDYVETHGSGTPLGDVIEVQSLSEVLGTRTIDQPYSIGSVKTNIGHLEAASGIAGLIKTALLLQQGEIPPHLYFRKINSGILTEKNGFIIPTLDQISDIAPKFAGVSSFGFGGTNAHIVLQSFYQDHNGNNLSNNNSSVKQPHHVLSLSAKSAEALNELAKRYSSYLADNKHELLGDICFTANTSRSHFNHRLAIVADCTRTLHERLAEVIAESNPENTFIGTFNKGKRPSVIFFCPHQNSLSIETWRLFRDLPMFKKTFNKCNEILRDHLHTPVLEALYQHKGINSVQSDDIYPALVAFQYSLSEMWRLWGVEPVGVFGEGVGEISAACVLGELDLETALQKATKFGLGANSIRNVPNGQKESCPEVCDISLVLGQTDDHLKTRGGPKTQFGNIIGGRDNRESLYENLARLYVAGVNVNWASVDEGYKRKRLTGLPTYPFQRKRFWLDPSEIRSY